MPGGAPADTGAEVRWKAPAPARRPGGFRRMDALLLLAVTAAVGAAPAPDVWGVAAPAPPPASLGDVWCHAAATAAPGPGLPPDSASGSAAGPAASAAAAATA
jgi:hypothetical protein